MASKTNKPCAQPFDEQNPTIPPACRGPPVCTVRVTKPTARNHVYPTIRLPEFLGDLIGSALTVYVSSEGICIEIDEYIDANKNYAPPKSETDPINRPPKPAVEGSNPSGSAFKNAREFLPDPRWIYCVYSIYGQSS